VAAGIPFGHVSSGCIYNGAHVVEGGKSRLETDLTRPELKRLPEENPSAIRGFAETDEPNFSFRRPPCSFYSGTKALAEEGLTGLGQHYIWRLRIPFDEWDGPRNYLSKLQRYPKVYDNVNSISHRGDFAKACLDAWERRVPFGIYNVTNPGYITSRQVVAMIQKTLQPGRRFEFWAGDEEFYRVAVTAPRSNCVLDTSKLLAAGVQMRTVQEAVTASLKHWKKEK
jgi:UDP-glucose 4,6-dehydratase